jgi:hypothetical protein
MMPERLNSAKTRLAVSAAVPTMAAKSSRPGS